MPQVIGVRFRTSPRVYYFAPTEGEEYAKNSQVVVETQRGVELATVVLPTHEVTDEQIVAPLKPVMRKATESDLAAARADLDQKHDILATAREKVSARGLDMKIVDCEFTVDHSKLVLYFTSENRVDFRELVRDLASAFRMRIDLRQIGARDECKLIGSLGACGMPCCCGRFESDAAHVSIKMAKNQSLALTPNKINGMCGRLLCCLAYENKTYEDIMRRMPKHGAWVTCADGRRGTVVSVTPLTEKVRVRIGNDESFEFCELPLDELSFDRPNAVDGERPKQSDGGAGDRGDRGERRERGGKPQRDKNRKNGDRRDNNNRDGGNRDNNNRGGQRPNGAPRGDNAELGAGNGNGNDRQSQNGGKNKNKRRKDKRRDNGAGGERRDVDNRGGQKPDGGNGGKPDGKGDGAGE